MALTDSLISYYKLDESSGDRTDSLAANNLTDTNTVGSAAGKISNAASFSAASSECLLPPVPASDSWPVNSDSFSICAWVYLTAAVNNQMVVTRWNESSSSLRHWQLFASPVSGGVWRFFCCQNSTTAVFVNGSAVALNTWTFLHAYCDSGSSIGLQVNAGTAVTASIGTPTTLSSQQAVIGARYNTTRQLFWDGRIDELGIWKGRVLSAAEVTSLYNGGVGLTYPFGVASNHRRRAAQTIIRGAF